MKQRSSNSLAQRIISWQFSNAYCKKSQGFEDFFFLNIKNSFFCFEKETSNNATQTKFELVSADDFFQ